MRSRKVLLLAAPLLLIVFLLLGFPISSMMAGRSQSFSGDTASRQNQQKSAPPVTTRPFSGSLPKSGKLALNVERRNHTATALADGRVLIIGGDNLDGAVGEVELLDPKSSTLVVAAKSLTARTKHSATLLPNGKVLVTGGSNQESALDSTEVFDPKTGTFSAGPSLQRARAGHSATLLSDGRVLLAGGQGEDSAEIFDPETNRSVLLSGKLTAARSGHATVLLKDGSVLITGGEASGGHALEAAEIFNPVTQSFSATANPMLIPRAHSTLRVLPDGKVQVIGGDFDGTMEIYDPAIGRFTALAHLAPTAEIFEQAEMLSAQTRAAFADARGYRDPQIKRPNAKGLKAAFDTFQKQEIGRSRYTATEIQGRQQVALIGGMSDDRKLVGSVLLLPSSPATVSTSKAQYLPGEAPVITGTGWQAGEVLTIIRQESRLGHKRRTMRVVADQQGNFTCTDLTANDYQVWTSYTLTARGQASEQIAQTSYFDTPLPGKEKESLPPVLKFQLPITIRDGSVETETVIFKWHTNSPYIEPENLVGAANATSAAIGSSCTIPNGSIFNYNANFSDVINKPCFGIAGNPCSGFGDVQFKSACMAFSGSINAELSLVPAYAKFSVQEDFKGGGTLKIDLNNSGTLNLLNIPIVGLNTFAEIPGPIISEAPLDIGISVRAKVTTTVTTPATVEVPFELSQGNEIGFDSRLSDPSFNIQTTPSGSDGDITVTKPGTASARVSLGPNLGIKATLGGLTVVDFGLGILGFIEPSMIDPIDTATCKAGKIDLNAGIEGNATAKLIGLFDFSNNLTFFSQRIAGFPKPYVTLDTQAPTITNLPNLTVPFDPNQCGAFVNYVPTITDTCSGYDSSTLVMNPAPRSFFPPGTTTVNVSGKDFAGNQATTSFTVTVQCPTINPLTPATLPNASLGSSYNQTIQVTPISNNYTFSVSAGFLPPGLQLVPGLQSALITGSPSQPGTYTFTITASSCAGCSVSQTYTINISCPAEVTDLSPTALPGGTLGTLYNQSVVASPTGAYNFAITQGALPPGLQLFQQTNAFTREIMGTPGQAGTFNFVITATRSGGACPVSRSYTITIACTTVALPNPIPNGTAGTVYNQFFVGQPISDYQYAVTAGTVPPGLSFISPPSASGQLAGTPTQAGTFNFTVKATSSGGCQGSQNYSMTIACPTILLPATVPNGTAGTAYFTPLAATPFLPTDTYTLATTIGNLPPGLSIDQTQKAIVGTPLTAGTYDFTVTATGYGACQGSRSYRITIACPTITLPSSLPNGTVGTAYSRVFTVSPAGAYTYGIPTGSLPAGLFFDPADHAVKGTPTQPGTYNFTIAVSGFNSCTQTQNYSVTIVCPPFEFLPLPGGTVGTAYNQKVTAALGAYTLALSGNLPPGVLFDLATGMLSGAPTTVGTFNFAVTATGPGTCTQTQNYSVVVVCPTIALTPATLPVATVNTAYNQALAATPNGTYSFSLTSGSLPLGLTLASDGTLSGAPAQSGTFNFRVTAAGLGSCSGFRDYRLIVACSTVSIAPATLPGATVGTAYDQTVAASPAGAYSYSVVSGALPTGLILNATTGRMTGTPTTGGAFNFTIAAGAGDCVGSRNYTLNIDCSAMVITTTSLPSGTAGNSYAQMVNVSPAAPAGSYTFSLAQGNLPSGLTLSPTTGLISGLPNVVGTYNFIIKAQVANGCNVTQPLTIAINCPTMTVSPASLPSGATTAAYNQTVSATPAGGNYTFGLTAGGLPPGLRLNGATGNLTGTPTQNGTFNFTVTATGFGSCTVSKSYSITIGNGGCPIITLPDLPGGAPGQLYNNAITGTPSASYNYTVTAGSLPPGLTLYGAAGLIFGFPTAAGTYNFTITATNLNNCSGERAYTVVIGTSALRSNATATNDFDGDGKSDLAVWRGTTSEWLIRRSSDDQLQTVKWGASYNPYRDVTVAADYDGDGKTDIAVFRRGNGHWYIRQSSDGKTLDIPWGIGLDVPVPADYDGDGKADIAVWRGSEGNWYIRRSSDDQVETVSWGSSSAPYNDIAVPGDYDGDGKTDVAVFRTSGTGAGHWFIKRSSDGVTVDHYWGMGTDVPVPADYDGDGKTDIAVWRGSDTNWYVVRSSDGATQIASWGASSLGDIPLPGDYDGDGKADLAIWRSTNSIWFVQASRDQATMAKPNGQYGDTPIGARP